MNKDIAKGKMNEIKGDVKQSIGNATDNPRMENEGAADKVKGKAQQAVGHGKEAVRDVIR